MKWPWSGSIAHRIKWGYYILVYLIVLCFLITAVNLAKVEIQVYELEKISTLLDTVLQIRQYEKNWILYNEPSDFTANQEKINDAFKLLDERQTRIGVGWHSRATAGEAVNTLHAFLLNYQKLIKKEFDLIGSGHQSQSLAPIREQGKQLVDFATDMSQSVRSSIGHTLLLVEISGILMILFVIFASFIIGRQLSVSIVNPLLEIVECTKKIASGDMTSFKSYVKNVDLVEINSVMNAFEVMLEKLEHREKLVIQHEKLAAVGTLVAGVAHELNNPLSNACTSAQILLEELDEEGEVSREFQSEMLMEITEQTDRARRIIRSLCEFSRQREVVLERIKLGDLLHQIINLVRGEVPQNVEAKASVLRDGEFWGDKQRLQQALVNLLLNAFFAVKEGGGVVTVRGNWDKEACVVTIEVEDSGPGIPEEIREKIFDPFYTTKDVGEGSGLGLAICREIVDKHGGTIEMKSEIDEGTRFTIEIPIEKTWIAGQANGQKKNTCG